MTPSIHPLSINRRLILFRVMGSAVPAGIHFGQLPSPLQGTYTIYAPKANLESPINLRGVTGDRSPRRKPCRHGENTQMPHRKAPCSDDHKHTQSAVYKSTGVFFICHLEFSGFFLLLLFVLLTVTSRTRLPLLLFFFTPVRLFF